MDRERTASDQTRTAVLNLVSQAWKVERKTDSTTIEGLALWFAFLYGEKAAALADTLEGEAQVKLLATVARNLTVIHRADQAAKRLELDTRRFEIKEREEEEKEKLRHRQKAEELRFHLRYQGTILEAKIEAMAKARAKAEKISPKAAREKIESEPPVATALDIQAQAEKAADDAIFAAKFGTDWHEHQSEGAAAPRPPEEETTSPQPPAPGPIPINPT